MLSVFSFGFFRGATSAIFRVFCRSTLLRSFFGKLFCNYFVQIYCSGKGDLGSRNLLVIHGKMLSFFPASSFGRFSDPFVLWT